MSNPKNDLPGAIERIEELEKRIEALEKERLEDRIRREKK